MKRLAGAVSIASLAILFAPALVSAAEDLGKAEYRNNCAVCHGEQGKGDGPYAGILDTVVPDLSTIQQRNGGVFPFDSVYQVIDGRTGAPAHGSREMPIWGNEYNERAVEYYRDYYLGYSAESFVRGRIIALIGYLYSMQKE